jgi:UDP-N-acetylglucosamine 2-epimerase (non-hydrolysing)
MKVLVCFGTRPEYIKLAPLINTLRASSGFEVKIYFTGQHSSDVIDVEAFQQESDFDFSSNVMEPGQSLEMLTSKVILESKIALQAFNPDLCVVHGDTSSAFACALSAFYQRIPIAHIEAGLRTQDLTSPFPEEFNRQAIARIASLHFSPTEKSRQNLIDEGVPSTGIFVTGNTVVDALKSVSDLLDACSDFRESVEESMAQRGLRFPVGGQIFLATAHRRESFDGGISDICRGIGTFASTHPLAQIIFPMHPNPVLQRIVKNALGGLENVQLTAPLRYAELVYILKKSEGVVTDSGGIQEEAVSLGKNVLVTRNVTERGEGLASGLLVVVGTDTHRIDRELQRIYALEKPDSVAQDWSSGPYGDGKAVDRVMEVLKSWKQLNHPRN